MSDDHGIGRLLAIMAALRTPVTGCPWDLEQTFETIAPFTIEEAYEVVDAIARKDRADLKDELGDLLLQVVYHARMAEEEGSFRFADVVAAVSDKMVRRHPHVFARAEQLPVDAVNDVWARIKEEENRLRGNVDASYASQSALEGVSRALPALRFADRLQRKAASLGFDWTDIGDVVDKIDEELEEARQAITAGDRSAIEAEIGDLIFSVVNLARHAQIDGEVALRRACEKFSGRFRDIEAGLAAQGKTPATSTLAEMEALWQKAKNDI